jgi:hypothetical protein
MDIFEWEVLSELLYVAETAEEAEAYASKEWEELSEEYQMTISSNEITSVNGYRIQLVKEGQ